MKRDITIGDLFKYHADTNIMWEKMVTKSLDEKIEEKDTFNFHVWDRLNKEFIEYNNLVLDFVL